MLFCALTDVNKPFLSLKCIIFVKNKKSMLSNIISKELGFAPDKVNKTIALLDDGATIPFIARYRKEVTGSMDEVAIGNIKDLYENYGT